MPAHDPRRGVAASGAPSAALQLVAVAAGPLAWAVQLVANYALAAHACFRRGLASAVAVPGWEGERAWLLAINVAAIAIAGVAFALGLRAIRWARAQSLSDERASRVIGRTHALGIAAVLFAGAFVLATLFTLVTIVASPQCPV